MTDTRSPLRILALLVSGIVAAALIGFIGYGRYQETQRNAALASSPCADAVATARRISPLAKGEVAALTMATAPLQIPDLAFSDSQGTRKTLADFRGKAVLLNLWATWCVPCRKEMPALNDLQKKLGAADFVVVAVNIDTRDAEKPKAFLSEAKLDALEYFTDPSARVFQDLKSIGRAIGMPTSVLMDAKGCEIATIAGPAEWDSADAVALLSAVKAR